MARAGLDCGRGILIAVTMALGCGHGSRLPDASERVEDRTEATNAGGAMDAAAADPERMADRSDASSLPISSGGVLTRTPVDAGAPSDAGPDTPRRLAPLPFNCAEGAWGKSRVDVGAVTLQVACRAAAERRGPLVVALHGYPELHLAWNRLAPPLVDLGFAWVAPDQRGYNRSDKPKAVSDYAIDHMVDDLHGLIQATGRSRVLLLGHDWGGLVAFIYAHRHPERVRGLVVMNAPHPDIWGRPEIDPVQAQATDSYVPLLAGPLGAFALPLLDSMLTPYLSAEELTLYRDAWNQPDALSSMNRWYSANLYPEVMLPIQVTVDVPTLVLFGMDDVYVTPSQLHHLPNYVTNLEIVKLDGVDHWTPHQATDRLVESIAAFEARLPPEGP